MDATNLVMSFCQAWTGPDLDRVIAMLSADIVYHNLPLQPLTGKPAVETYLRAAGPFDDCHWEVRHIAGAGEQVLTERVDRMVVGGHSIQLPVMGSFRVRQGQICEWRDYFDLASYRAQWPKPEARKAAI